MTLSFHNFEISARLFENVCEELTVGSKLSWGGVCTAGHISSSDLV